MHRVAIIGAGIGAQHLDAFAALPARFEIAALCDLNETRAAPLAAARAVPWVADLDAVIADPSVDVIDICLPPHLHLPVATQALEAGKAVICEKPLVGSLAEADALAATLTSTGGFLSPIFQYRYGPGMAQLQALIDAGLAGRCFGGSLETHWNRGADYYATPWRGTWTGEQGGAVLGHAIHIHDLVMFLLGPVSQVQAALATRVNPIETEDCAALIFQMATGALVTSSITLGAATDQSRLRLMFEGFTVESDHAPYAPAAKSWRFEARAPRTQAEIETVLATVPETPDGYVGQFAEISKALNGHAAAHVTFDDGRRALELITAIYAAARSGRAESLPLAPEHPYYAGWAP